MKLLKTLTHSLAQSLALSLAMLTMGLSTHAAAQSSNFQNKAATLRSSISVNKPLVTLGDLFNNAGAVATKPVFRSPSIGQSGTIRADRVIFAAQQAGLLHIDQNNVSIVEVSHASQLVTESDVVEAILSQLRYRGMVSSSGTVDVTFNNPIYDQHASIQSTPAFQVANLRFDRLTGRFSATMTIGGRNDLRPIRMSGKAVETVLVPTATRNIRQGEIMEEEDIALTPMPKRQARAGQKTQIKQIIGKAARQSMRAGAIISQSMFKLPEIVSRSDIVTILYKAGSLTLTMRGKSLSPGAKGDVISIQNLQTNRVVRAEVQAPGLVRVQATQALTAPTNIAALKGANQ